MSEYSYGNGGFDPRTIRHQGVGIPATNHLWDGSKYWDGAIYPPAYQQPIAQQRIANQNSVAATPEQLEALLQQIQSLQSQVQPQEALEEKHLEESVAKAVEQTEGVPSAEVIAQLRKIAAHELAGVLLYNYYGSILCLEEKKHFLDSAVESADHYQKTQEFIICAGNPTALVCLPDSEAMSSIPMDASGKLSASRDIAFERMIEHEKVAVEAYTLLAEMAGDDLALENFALSQVEVEKRDMIRLKMIAGLY